MKSRRLPAQRVPASLAVLAALVIGGCSSLCSDDSEPGATAVPSADGESAPGAAPARVGDLAEGEVRIVPNGDLVSVRSNQAKRLKIFGALARAYGFTQNRGKVIGEPAVVSLDLTDVPLEQAIAAALDGLDFSLHYTPTAAEGSALTAVTVGEATASSMRSMRAARRGNRERRSDPEASERLARYEREQAERDAERRAFVDERLASSDERLRAEGVSQLHTGDDAELEKLRELLENDPSSLVRAEAAENLASTNETAIGALIGALNDPDSDVRGAAIEALEFAADTEHIQAILATGILNDPDPIRRREALEMIEFLRD